jgi:hypothetical protein
LKAHLVSVDGKRGWKLSGRIGGFYVFDDAHHGSDNTLKLKVTGNVTGVTVTPITAPTATPPSAQPAPATPGTPVTGTATK